MGKVIYADFSAVPTLEGLTVLRDQTIRRLQSLVKGLAFTDPAGRRVAIEVKVDIANPQRPDVFYNASAKRQPWGGYEVNLGGGMLHRLDMMAQTLAADPTVLRGNRRSRLLDSQARAGGRRQVMASFAYSFLVDFVFWHEVAHITRGHTDWISRRGRGEGLAELHMTPRDEAEAADLRALEGDADRQAVGWAAASFDVSIQHNPYLRYQSAVDAFHDFGYLTVALFMLFDAFQNHASEALRTHPDNHHRLALMVSHVDQYLSKHRGDASRALHEAAAEGGRRALNQLLHGNRREIDAWALLRFLGELEPTIQRLGVRELRLSPDVVPGVTSFELPWVA
ncbi:hypothetical protein LXT12_20560 [Pelomonas sp. P7]|uniref:Peptidase U49 n=1 Tax=Pelomonas caseinilytica TaxID=2906763 RepID=A0ABS8XIR1_9BURK|nr:hypothetical protein [Pelomonas sp. P7]MCE4539648.1 hypothetical protein [Pelomonas sp. P7]